MRFPRVSGSTLDGDTRSLPADLSGSPSLLIISFHWQQRSLVDPWSSVAEQLEERFEAFEYYDLLVVDWRSRMLVGHSQREELLSDDQRDRILVLRVNKEQFRRSLGLLGEDTVYALLVDDGDVVRQGAGFPISAAVEGLWSLLNDWENAREASQTSNVIG